MNNFNLGFFVQSLEEICGVIIGHALPCLNSVSRFPFQTPTNAIARIFPVTSGTEILSKFTPYFFECILIPSTKKSFLNWLVGPLVQILMEESLSS